MSTEKQKTIWIRNKHPMLGKHHSKQGKINISKSKIGKPNLKLKETIKRLGLNKGEKNPNFGRKMSNEIKKKISNAVKGEKNSNWIDGRSKLVAPGRYGDDWDKIRYLVYCRDKFTCQECGIKKVKLDIHHKIPFLISFDNSLNNLITLCRSCHMKTERLLNRRVKNGCKM